MSLDRTDTRGPSSRRPPAARPAAPRLRSAVVRYESSSDRRTVYPVGVAESERLTTWLSADDDAFVDLDAYR